MFGLLALAAAIPASAAVSFTLTTGKSATSTQDMTFDSNQCPAQGPVAAWVGGIVTNSGGSAVTGISANLAALGNGFALVSSSTATQSLGVLGAGETVSVYWHVSYSCTNNAVTAPIVTLSSSLGTQTSSLTLNAKKALSANAGGNVASANLGPGAVVGQTVFYDTTYSFGSSSAGDEVFLQPAGNTSFNSACFRLSKTQITASAINGVPLNATNQLYFVSSTANGNGASVSVRYWFQYLCASTSTIARPYAQLTSGTQLKYTGNYDGSGSIAVSYPGATNPFTISKTASITSFLAGTATVVTYTVTISNPSANETYLGKITDTLPAGVTFGALASGSGVTATNSSTMPASGATGTITFTGKLNQSYLLPAGGTVVLKYTATVPGTAGSYINNAFGTFGTSTTTPVATATVTVSNPQPLGVTKGSTAHTDPVNGAINPKLIPGGFLTYLINVENPNVVALGTDSLIITDPTATNLHFSVADFGAAGSGPAIFTNGSSASALTYSFISLASQTDDIDFSNNGGLTWTYVPAPAIDGTDSNVNTVRIRPKGAMAAASSFSVSFRYRIN